MSHATATSPTAFDFPDFAREIYSENPRVHEEKFLLPALYGGETGYGTFKALVVLEAPAMRFTTDRWTQCTTPEEAIDHHRKIFFAWAFSKREPAALFSIFVDTPSTYEDFFRCVYVTDIWKDADFKKKKSLKRDNYRHYWRSKLATEIERTAAERVIFVGGEALLSGRRHVAPGTPTHCIVFPSPRNPTFETEVQQLRREIHGEDASEVLSKGSAERPSKEVKGGVNTMSHDWTLNDEINHNKFGVIPINQSLIRMNLSYQRSRNGETVPVGSFSLDMNDLLRNNLVREVEKGGKRGFLLRFVHDLTDNGIYVRLNQHSPSRFLAKVPAHAL